MGRSFVLSRRRFPDLGSTPVFLGLLFGSRNRLWYRSLAGGQSFAGKLSPCQERLRAFRRTCGARYYGGSGPRRSVPVRHQFELDLWIGPVRTVIPQRHLLKIVIGHMFYASAGLGLISPTLPNTLENQPMVFGCDHHQGACISTST